MIKKKLTAFIYFLGRDYLTLGQIEKIMEQLEPMDLIEPKYSNEQLADYARDVTGRILGA